MSRPLRSGCSSLCRASARGSASGRMCGPDFPEPMDGSERRDDFLAALWLLRVFCSTKASRLTPSQITKQAEFGPIGSCPVPTSPIINLKHNRSAQRSPLIRNSHCIVASCQSLRTGGIALMKSLNWDAIPISHQDRLAVLPESKANVAVMKVRPRAALEMHPIRAEVGSFCATLHLGNYDPHIVPSAYSTKGLWK